MSSPLLNEQSLQLRQSVVFAIILQMWHTLSLATEERLCAVPSRAATDLKAEIMSSSLALATKVWLQQQHQQLQMSLHKQQAQRRRSPEPVGFTHFSASEGKGGGWKETSGTHSIGYVSISPSPSELAVPNVVYAASPTQQREHVNVENMIHHVGFDNLLLLREALLPLFNASGVKVSSQLKRTCHNSSEFNVEYKLSLMEGGVTVIDGRPSVAKPGPPRQNEPVLLLDQFDVSGNLKYLAKYRPSQLGNSLYLITTSSEPPAEVKTSRQRPNITSKFSVRLDTVAANVTVPLMMLCRHSSESLLHWTTQRRLAHSSRRDEKPVVAVNGLHLANSALESVEETDLQETPLVWTASQRLVECFISLERDHNPQQTAETPRNSETGRVTAASTPQSHRVTASVPEFPHSPKYPRAQLLRQQEGGDAHLVLHPGQLSSGQSLTSLTSVDHQDSPAEVAIKMEPIPRPSVQFISHAMEAMDETTDSQQIFSSDNDAPVQSSLATYNIPQRLTGGHNRRLQLESAVEHANTSLETPNLREGLSVVDEQLQFSVFGLVKISTIQIQSQLETLLSVLEIRGVTGAVDCRKMARSKLQHQQNLPSKPSKTLLVYKGVFVILDCIYMYLHVLCALVCDYTLLCHCGVKSLFLSLQFCSATNLSFCCKHPPELLHTSI